MTGVTFAPSSSGGSSQGGQVDPLLLKMKHHHRKAFEHYNIMCNAMMSVHAKDHVFIYQIAIYTTFSTAYATKISWQPQSISCEMIAGITIKTVTRHWRVDM